MKEKTIKQILRKKVNDWIDHVEDEEIKTIIKSKTIITGGAIVNLIEKPHIDPNAKVNDFDVYFRDKESVLKVADYYIKQFNKKKISFAELKEELNRVKIFIQSSGVVEEKNQTVKDQYINAVTEADEIPDNLQEEEKEKYRPVFMSTNAITLSNKIQIVVRFYGEPEEIHKNYDFVHCTCYWSSWDNKLVIPKEALMSIVNKELRYQGSLYPLCSVMRMRKFIKRGWSINAGQVLKILFQVSKLDLNNISVLEDQLVGVDTGYFLQLIDALKNKMEKDSSFKIDQAYVCTILDRIFG